MYEQSRRNNVRLNAILNTTVIRMSRVELTNHPVKDFAVILIQLLQSANDMVQVMRDEVADYAISGFTEQMVPTNNAHIEQLRGWVSPEKL